MQPLSVTRMLIRKYICHGVHVHLTLIFGIICVWSVYTFYFAKHDLFQDNRLRIDSEEDLLDKENLQIVHRRRREAPNIYHRRAEDATRACHGKLWQYHGSYSNMAFRSHMLINRKFNVMFCGIEKIGYTFWRRLFKVMNDSVHQRSPYELHPYSAYSTTNDDAMTLDDVTPDEEDNLLNSSIKVVFVRDPYNRLFSAYVDKLFFPNIVYWKNFGTSMIKRNRNQPDKKSLACGHDVTFSEFVKDFIKSQSTLLNRDNHYIPMYEHCRPCKINYDLIGKMETFGTDMFYVLKTLKADKLSAALQSPESDSVKDAFLESSSHYSYAVYSHKLDNCISTDAAMKRLWRTMQIRGLIGIHSKCPFSGSNSSNIPRDELLQALLSASNISQAERQTLRTYKRRAMIEAYSTVDRRDLHTLAEIFRPDCDVFGYNCTPAEVFTQTDDKPQNQTNIDILHLIVE